VIATINYVILDWKELIRRLNSANVMHICRTLKVKTHELVGRAKVVGSKNWLGYVPPFGHTS
jgi:hypothetical protein